MTKEVEKKLQTYHLVSDKKGMSSVIDYGQKKIMSSQVERYAYLNLLLHALRYINWQTWISQFGILLISVIAVYRFSFLTTASLMKSLTFLLVISVLFFLDEIFKSFTSGMWELEQTFKYDLRQYTLTKLFILGTVDLFLIFILSLLTKSLYAIPFFKIMLYLLVPYNLICILLLVLVGIWRRGVSLHHMWMVTGILFMIGFIVMNQFSIYQVKLVYWLVIYLITTACLIGLITIQIRKIMEDRLLWN